jgi:hypothetical protein
MNRKSAIACMIASALTTSFAYAATNSGSSSAVTPQQPYPSQAESQMGRSPGESPRGTVPGGSETSINGTTRNGSPATAANPPGSPTSSPTDRSGRLSSSSDRSDRASDSNREEHSKTDRDRSRSSSNDKSRSSNDKSRSKAATGPDGNPDIRSEEMAKRPPMNRSSGGSGTEAGR